MPTFRVVIERTVVDYAELTVQAESKQQIKDFKSYEMCELIEDDEAAWEDDDYEIRITEIEEYPEPEKFEAADPRQLDLDLTEMGDVLDE